MDTSEKLFAIIDKYCETGYNHDLSVSIKDGLSLSSFEMMMIFYEIKLAFNIEIDYIRVSDLKTMADLVDYVSAKVGEKNE